MIKALRKTEIKREFNLIKTLHQKSIEQSYLLEKFLM